MHDIYLPKISLTPSEEKIIQKIRSLDIHLLLDAILNELERAENKFPKWPADIVHAGAIVSEESGFLNEPEETTDSLV